MSICSDSRLATRWMRKIWLKDLFQSKIISFMKNCANGKILKPIMSLLAQSTSIWPCEPCNSCPRMFTSESIPFQKLLTSRKLLQFNRITSHCTINPISVGKILYRKLFFRFFLWSLLSSHNNKQRKIRVFLS